MQHFKVTKNHLKLLKRMVVGWCGDEAGAPGIDPKRPYGNSAVAEDILDSDGEKDREDSIAEIFLKNGVEVNFTG